MRRLCLHWRNYINGCYLTPLLDAYQFRNNKSKLLCNVWIEVLSCRDFIKESDYDELGSLNDRFDILQFTMWQLWKEPD